MYANEAALNNERGFSTFGALGIHVSNPIYFSSMRTAEIHISNQNKFNAYKYIIITLSKSPHIMLINILKT